jgi:archaellin
MMGGSLGLGAVGLASLTILIAGAAHEGVIDPGGMIEGVTSLGGDAEALARDTADSLVPVIDVLHVVGTTDDGEHIGKLTITVRPVTSAREPNLTLLAVRLADADRERWLGYDEGPGDFKVRALRDTDGSLAPPSLKLTKGDLAELRLPLQPDGADFALEPRATFRLELVPDTGPSLMLGLETPPTFAGARLVTLR